MEQIFKIVEKCHREYTDKVIERVLNCVEKISSNVELMSREINDLSRRVTEQEQASCQCDKHQSQKLSEEIAAMNASLGAYSTSAKTPTPAFDQRDDCEVLLSGIPSNVGLADTVILEKTFATMGLHNFGNLITRTRPWRPKNHRPSAQNTSSIVVQCSSPIVRDRIVSQSHRLARVTVQSIFGTDGAEKHLSLSPLLPKQLYHLLREARSFSHKLNFISPIVRNSTIFIRKSSTSPAIPIHSIIDLNAIT